MFNVGGMELVVICLVALIVLGPERLPGAIRQLGRVSGEIRRISQGFQTDFRTAMDQAEREAEAELASRAAAAPGAPASTAPSSQPGRTAAMDAAQAELDALLAAPPGDVDAARDLRP